MASTDLKINIAPCSARSRMFLLVARAGQLLCLSLALAACSGDGDSGSVPGSTPLPAAGPSYSPRDSGRASFLLYLTDAKPVELESYAKSLDQVRDGAVNLQSELPLQAVRLSMGLRRIDPSEPKGAPPDAETLGYFGRGLSSEQIAALNHATSAWKLDFNYPAADSPKSLAIVDKLVLELAQEANALIWDSEARLMYSRDYFREHLVADSAAGGSVQQQTAIHAYKDGSYVRAVSVGMIKFGQADLVIEQLSWATQDSLVWLMIASSQLLVDGARPDPHGQFAFDARLIRHDAVRNAVLETTRTNATLNGMLRMVPVTPAEGDAENDLIAIRFDDFPGTDAFARQESAVSQIFGWHDAVKRIDHNEDLLAASKEARRKLPALKRDFEAGLAPGEYIQVKAPFVTQEGGREWMWVEVTTWKSTSMRGLLRNEPFDIPELHSGQLVDVDPSEVFDYLRRSPDGREEGNTTSEIIKRMQGDLEQSGEKRQ